MKKSTLHTGFLLMIVCTLFTSAGQLLWKAGALQIHLFDPLTYLNLPFIIGCLFYVIGSILMIVALKNGELSILFPIIATSYVWVSIFAPLFFPSEAMNGWKWAGVFVILFSVSLLGWSSSISKARDDAA